MRALVVDDERAVRQAVRRGLEIDGWEVTEADDGASALDELGRVKVDAIVLDIAMPHMDGLEFCRLIRSEGDRTPVLMLTARTQVEDRVEGLDAGADDYLVKPFSLEELKARMRALLRRVRPQDTGDDQDDDSILQFANISVDQRNYEVRVGDREVELTRTEFSLLELFMENPRQVLSRSLINERVWGYDFSDSSNSLAVYIGYLRRKLEAGGEPRLIETVRGIGYAMREPRDG